MSRGGIIRSSRQTRQSIAQSDPLSVQCQYIANPMSIHCQSDANPMPILCQSTANLIPINCQSNFNSVPIRFQSNQINPRLPTSHHSGTHPLTIKTVQCQYNVNSVPICQSITSLPIQESRTNLQTHHQFDNPSLISNPCPSANPLPIHTSSADPWQITQFNANPTQHQSTKTIPDRSTNPWPITNNSPNCTNRRHSNHSHWHSISNGRANPSYKAPFS